MSGWRMKLWLSVLLALVLCFSSCAIQRTEPLPKRESRPSSSHRDEEVDDPEEETPPAEDPVVLPEPDEGESWAIYWYLCGSDLETNYGCATMDLEEMLAVTLPENVQVVIETGGARQWQNDVMDPDYLERYVYSGDELQFVEQKPLDNMGDPDTLADFLQFCVKNYPADRTMVLFWDHGGGSVSGVAFDERYNYDSLTLGEIYEAFNEVYDLSTETPPVDVVGFDACLMATIDTAYTLCDVSRYLVASQELEPGNGWNYTGWLEALAADPTMNGAEMGQAICDSYALGCKEYGTGDEITLSVVSLTEIGPLLSAYDQMGQEALLAALQDPLFFSSFGRAAGAAENYGGNTDELGYTNMVDLGHLSRNCTGLLPGTAQAVLDGLDACVVYEVNGPYRQEATGLSCYYSYSGSRQELAEYCRIGTSEAFQYLYSYELEGVLSSSGLDYAAALGYEAPTTQELPGSTLDPNVDIPLYIDDDGCAVLDIGPAAAETLTGAYFYLAYVDIEEDFVILLGRDNDLEMDWENGVFRDNFWGTWCAIDGWLVYMELVYEGPDYNAYSVPILLNGEEYHLRVVYNHSDGEYHILGARKGLYDTGMADKNMVKLQPGDEITTIHYAATITGPDDFTPYDISTFTVTEHTSIEQVDLGDGDFMLMFELIDIQNQVYFSEPAFFTVEGNNIYTYTG